MVSYLLKTITRVLVNCLYFIHFCLILSKASFFDSLVDYRIDCKDVTLLVFQNPRCCTEKILKTLVSAISRIFCAIFQCMFLFFVLCIKLLYYSVLKCYFKQVIMENSICLWLLAGCTLAFNSHRFLRPILLTPYLIVSDTKSMSILYSLQSCNSFITFQICFSLAAVPNSNTVPLLPSSYCFTLQILMNLI